MSSIDALHKRLERAASRIQPDTPDWQTTMMQARQSLTAKLALFMDATLTAEQKQQRIAEINQAQHTPSHHTQFAGMREQLLARLEQMNINTKEEEHGNSTAN